jgi:hypothetical protein
MKVKLRKAKSGLFTVHLMEDKKSSKVLHRSTSSIVFRYKEPEWARTHVDAPTKMVRPGLLEVHLDNEDTKACGKTKT